MKAAMTILKTLRCTVKNIVKSTYEIPTTTEMEKKM